METHDSLTVPPAPAWNPVDYAQSSSVQQMWARELIAKLALRGNERVLDIGCGDGKVTAEIASAVPQGCVVGIDSSAEMVGYAATRFENVANLRFESMDARSLRFQGEFDVGFSNAALHWVQEHKPIVSGIAAALKHGGRILLQMGGRGNAATVLEAVRGITARPRWAPFFTGFDFRYGFYGPEEYIPWLQEAGFAKIRAELIPKDMVQADRPAFAGWLRTTWMPWLNCVPIEQREPFVDEIVDAYGVTYPPDGQGRFHLPMIRLEVEAVFP